jgi:hypothetical protein
VTDVVAIVTHDTERIVAVDDATCTLFRQERERLIGGDLLEGVRNGNLKFLTKVRMYIARGKGKTRRDKIEFARADGTFFWAWSETTRREDGLFNTELTYISEANG